MKRKWFTLLFALVALASFQVSATGPWWIKADITGLEGNRPYSGNKVDPQNWLVWSTNTTDRINEANHTLFGDAAIDKFDVSRIGLNDNLINIKNLKSGSGNLSLPYGGNNWAQFEVVQFGNGLQAGPNGSSRTTQPLTLQGMEGYLVPAQGGDATLPDTTSSMLMVVTNPTTGALAIQRFDQWAAIATKTAPVYHWLGSANTAWLDLSANVSSVNASYLASATGVAIGESVPNVSYNKAVAYLAVDWTTVPNGNITDTTKVTRYIGPHAVQSIPAEAVFLADPANWTNGLPFNQDNAAQVAPMTDPASWGTPDTSNAWYVVVVQEDGAAGSQTVFDKLTLKGAWRPVWIKLEKPAGRWARQEDFPTCDYVTLGKLSVRPASIDAGKNVWKDAVNVFKVTQVDWVAKHDNNQSQQNIFGNKNETGYYHPAFDSINLVNHQQIGQGVKGLQPVTSLAPVATGDFPDSVIPLFTLSSPNAGCDVVSISRLNEMDIQSQGDGIYANQLEIRPYGAYRDYHLGDGSTTVYREHTASTVLSWDRTHDNNHTGDMTESRVATSLQKFAFWIDDEGNFTMYPAASYAWEYGNDKEFQLNTVLPNSVLLYNNTEITETTGGLRGSDKGWGIQIGTWNGNTTKVSVGKQITTIPNVLQDRNDYDTIRVNPACAKSALSPLEGRFFFLDVDKTDIGVPTAATATGAFRANAIQAYDKTEYVLSVESDGGSKRLVVLPKEKVRRYADENGNKWYTELAERYKRKQGGDTLSDYWSNHPFDMVNMAAHWEIINKGTAEAPRYLLINMLGDTLQYNIPAANPTPILNLAGTFAPINNEISNNARFRPVGLVNGLVPLVSTTDISMTDVLDKWFGYNVPLANATTQNEWIASAIPGSDKDVFVLKLGSYTLDVNSDWLSTANDVLFTAAGSNKAVPTSGVIEAKGVYARTDSTYFKRYVDLILPATGPFPWNTMTNPSCKAGLKLKKSPIYYVPNYSASYGLEPKDLGSGSSLPADSTINTNDKNFIKQDSLTAYLLLDGKYGIKEAEVVSNGMLLGSTHVEYGFDALTLTDSANKASAYQIEFIPLANTQRNAMIELYKNLGLESGPSIVVADRVKTDKLYNETYKWYLVKRGDQYLVFDTINPGTDKPQFAAGLTWKNLDGEKGYKTVANATPVRLYQPLVGDKLQGNFIFEFYVPNYIYSADENGTDPLRPRTRVINYPDPSSTTNPYYGRGSRQFGQLSKQSNYIHGVNNANNMNDNNAIREATRFTYTYIGENPPPCNCQDSTQFVSPQWMAKEKLIGLPIQDQIWLQSGATGYAFTTSSKVAGEAIADVTTSNLTHLFVDSLRRSASQTTAFYHYDNVLAPTITSPQAGDVTGFYKDLPVYLYRVQDPATGKYLTVGKTTYQYNSKETVNDVTGVNLIWDDLYTENADPAKNTAALQLFAITGPERPVGKDGWYSCGTYVYLPLASYKVVYKDGKVDDTTIHYNLNLGKKDSTSCYEKASDVTKAYRVSQYSQLGREHNLVVANASGTSLANVVPVELKWKKNTYDKLPCDYKLVRLKSGNYYKADGTVTAHANSNTILAHWKNTSVAGDPYLYKFVAEGFSYYGSTIALTPSPLALGEYYFIKQNDSTFVALNFANYATNYKAASDTLVVTCVEHTLPYYDLEPDYELPAQLATLETPFTDRNLSDRAKGFPVVDVYGNGTTYRVYLNQIAENRFDSATYLTAYKTLVRKLGTADGHDIPYFAFSLTKGNAEYFLNVSSKAGKDSVYWSSITAAEKTALLDSTKKLTLANSGLLKFQKLRRFQFCLPYQVNSDGTRKAEVAYGDQTYPPVYLQTLDNDRSDSPYLVVAGAATSYATAVSLDAVYRDGYTKPTTDWNIYSVDYSLIDEEKVTAWIFGGRKGPDHEWVPLRDPNGVSPITGPQDGKNVDGLLANYTLHGGVGAISSFVGESQVSPVNYGVLLNKTELHFEYEGTEQIKSIYPLKRPIYYYRIQIKGASAGSKWLTDSKDSTSANYNYVWGITETDLRSYDIAYFGAKLGGLDFVPGKLYDKKYRQTFGLRYTGVENGLNVPADDKVAAQTFTVVANADYTKSGQDAYRYLAEVNGHLVFVEGIRNALLFQFGRDKDGNYTGIEVVGQGNVIGVSGGVRILNETGKVDLYTVDGSLIKSTVITGADQTITAPRGIVIVKIGSKATKVVVK